LRKRLFSILATLSIAVTAAIIATSSPASATGSTIDIAVTRQVGAYAYGDGGDSSDRLNANRGPAASGAASPADSVIVCTLQIQNPHKSTHVPGTVNIVATYSCSATVVELDIEITLYRNGLYVSDGSDSVEVTSAMQANAATGCVSGTYQGVAIGHVQFPAGYEPNTQAGDVVSNSVYISCP
jgi:hypothetical protein